MAAIVKQSRGSGGSFGLHYDIIKHLVDLRVVLLEIIEVLARQLQSVLLGLVPAPYQHFKSLKLQFAEAELVQLDQHYGLAALEVGLDVSGVVDDAFQFYLKLSTPELPLHLLQGAQLVSIVDVDEVRLDVVRNGLIVLSLPEFGLPRGTVQPELPHLNQIHHSYLIFYTPNNIVATAPVSTRLTTKNSLDAPTPSDIQFILQQKQTQTMATRRTLNPERTVYTAQRLFQTEHNRRGIAGKTIQPIFQGESRCWVHNEHTLTPSKKPGSLLSSTKGSSVRVGEAFRLGSSEDVEKQAEKTSRQRQYLEHLRRVSANLQQNSCFLYQNRQKASKRIIKRILNRKGHTKNVLKIAIVFFRAGVVKVHSELRQMRVIWIILLDGIDRQWLSIWVQQQQTRRENGAFQKQVHPGGLRGHAVQ